MASNFLSAIQIVLHHQWKGEWTAIINNKLREIKDNVQLWRPSIHASRHEEVVITCFHISITMITHGFLVDQGNPPQYPF